MSRRSLIALLCALLALAGCEQFDTLLYGSAHSAETAAAKPPTGATDASYVNPRAQETVAALRSIYIAPVNLANMQVIQPEGAAADAEWWVTDEENQALQSAITFEFAAALGYKSAFNVVASPGQADMVLNTAVIAVHPNETRGSLARQSSPGGAITASMVVVNARTEQVILRVVDTRVVEDVWAFNLAAKDDPALGVAFRGWGEAIRLGLLQAQGRPPG